MANLASERALFEACLAETGPAQARLLADAAAQNPDLAARVRRLLLAHAQTRDLMVPVPPHAPELPPEAGDYELLRVIGEGGMGVVWEAEQKAPVQRRVALKVVRAGPGRAETARKYPLRSTMRSTEPAWLYRETAPPPSTVITRFEAG